MSTKSTLFLTKDNEHCYYETNSSYNDAEGKHIGYDIELQFDKKNISEFYEDEDSYSLTIPPESEIYSLIEKMDIEHKPKEAFPTKQELINALEISKKHNAELLKKLEDLNERLNRLDR